ncbi:MAG: TetR/AcrR family transcriptional regulator [Propionibacteriaceae bacterium]
MAEGAPVQGRPAGRLRADKHDAIMAGGREAFARDGYERASIDTIAAASNVSTRTIYKHFADKAALFAAVIADSAAEIAAAETALIERRLVGITHADEIEAALARFATEWLAGTARTAAHRAVISRVHAESTHLGSEVVTTWWLAGPGRVIAELAAVLAGWAEAGLLEIAHPERAALHFSALVSVRPGAPGSRFTRKERQVWIADGVRVFVRAHRP